MSIFDVLSLIGGLCLFLFGMNVMGDALERRAGGGLKLLLGQLTKNKFKYRQRHHFAAFEGDRRLRENCRPQRKLAGGG